MAHLRADIDVLGDNTLDTSTVLRTTLLWIRVCPLTVSVLEVLVAAGPITIPDRRPLPVEMLPTGSMHTTAATMMTMATTQFGRKQISPLTTLSARAK